MGEVVNVGQQLNLSNAFTRAEGSAWDSFIGLPLAAMLAGLGALVSARGRAVNDPERR